MRFVKIALAACALTLGAGAAEAGVVSWNFGTSGGTLNSNASGQHGVGTAYGSFGAPSQPFNGPISNSGDMAVFGSDTGGLFVGARAYSNGGNNAFAKITQRDNADYGQTGIGVCGSLCDGNRQNVSDTEWLRVDLNNPNAGAADHDGWDLQSIVFGNILGNPLFQIEFWFSDGATKSDAQGSKNFSTKLQSTDLCDVLTGTSCFFDLTTFGPSINAFDYLWITAGTNPNAGGNPPQPQILLTQLNGVVPDASVPEPATFALLGAGLLGLGWARRRKAA